jgi:hypothetical protein
VFPCVTDWILKYLDEQTKRNESDSDKYNYKELDKDNDKDNNEGNNKDKDNIKDDRDTEL